MVVLILIAAISALYMYIKKKLSKGHSKDGPIGRVGHLWDYDKLRTMIRDTVTRVPAMFVDLDVLDSNIKRLVEITKPSGKTLRIATKSIRCPELIERVVKKGEGVIKGLMCFSVQEVGLLCNICNNLDDFYVPYPTLQYSDIKLALELGSKGKKITLTVDCIEQVDILDQLCCEIKTEAESLSNPEQKLRLAIDIDMATTILGMITLGPHRSRINSVTKFAELAQAINKSSNLSLVGAMGYEAHVAGLPDDNPYYPFPNPIIRVLKGMFLRCSCDLRNQIAKYCSNNGINLEFFNGGGSGNIQEACADNSITEVTAGSAFLQAKLFDYYVKNQCSPAFCFALQCTRIKENYICCQSGGFVASGSNSQDKFPIPFANPVELRPFKDEGYGEVQTPLELMDKTTGGIKLGDPVFFRPAKSGEIGEHFNSYYLKKDYKIVGQAKTYRGFGCCFH